MKAYFASIALALSGAAIAAPFNGTYNYPTGSGLSKPSQSSTDVPLPNLFTSLGISLPAPIGTPSGTLNSGTLATSTSLKTGSGTATFSGQPTLRHVKRAHSGIPTGLASLASEAESALGVLASIVPQKRADSTIPTGLASLASEAESAIGALSTMGSKKRANAAFPTGLASLASEAESALSALASLIPQKRAYSFTPPTFPSSTGAPSGTPSGSPTSVATGAPSFVPSFTLSTVLPGPTSDTSIPASSDASSTTGFSLFGIPMA
ncbi:hypothetical protein N7523_007342 [Penicillium sp. IBT 18751x]|nr:hypothetical protein N7523_007342 [Penicillium sp. IBT 18751x]